MHNGVDEVVSLTGMEKTIGGRRGGGQSSQEFQFEMLKFEMPTNHSNVHAQQAVRYTNLEPSIQLGIDIFSFKIIRT